VAVGTRNERAVDGYEYGINAGFRIENPRKNAVHTYNNGYLSFYESLLLLTFKNITETTPEDRNSLQGPASEEELMRSPGG
jgi:hypothetical protein